MKHLYEYINEKLVLHNKTKIRPVHYNDIEDNFKKICDFKGLIDTNYESEHINFYFGYVLSKPDFIENFLCGWSFIEYWDDWAGGIDAPSEFFYIVNEEQFKFFDETHDLKKNETNGGYEAPEWLTDILYELNIDAAFSSDFNAFIITVDDFCNNKIIKSCWNQKIEKNIIDLKEKFKK